MRGFIKEKRVIALYGIILILSIIWLRDILYSKVTVSETNGVIITTRETDDGLLNNHNGYYISHGDYGDYYEIVIREKESYVMTIITYDLEGNLMNAEVIDFVEE